MSVALTAVLTKLNNLIDDNITGTTDAAGNAGGTTFVDSALSKYEDNYFGDPERATEWWAYIGTALRSIKNSQGSSGTLEVHKAFAAQIATATAYALHRFDRDKKIAAINIALNDSYPWFHQRVEDESTLTGTGGSDNDYQVPSAFVEFPDRISEKQVSGSKTTYVEITDYVPTEVSGTMYFYASITTGNKILLVGKKHLSQFTTDASTTELTDGQASVVALLAASILFRMLSTVVNATDSGRLDSLAKGYERRYEDKKIGASMPVLKPSAIDFGWLPSD